MPDVNFGTLLYVGAGALAAAALLTALTAWPSIRRLRARCARLESSLGALRLELEKAASIGVRNEGRVTRIEQDYGDLAECVKSVESRGTAGPFDRAIERARRGADAAELRLEFALSHSEAELISRLHGRKQRA
jgi:hypothetical protein